MPFENQLTIDIKAFFFNAKTDYLPYYKNFSLTLPKETSLKEVLAEIKERNSDFSYPEEDLLFRVNDLIVTGEEKIGEVVEELGTELTIDPALKYRSDNGLILNNHDFMHQFRTVFKRHLETKEDLEYYTSLYPLHYASETLQYNREYIGDAILLTAHKMITDGSEYKEEILQAIDNPFNGIRCCEYENNVFKGEDQRAKIEELKAMIGFEEKPSFVEKISALTLREHQHEVEHLEGMNIALYLGDKDSKELTLKIKKEIEESGAKFIDFKMSTKLAGQTIITTASELAYRKIGTVLLDALDSGAEILICAKESDADFFKRFIGRAEREIGREIELKIITIDQFEELRTKEMV